MRSEALLTLLLVCDTLDQETVPVSGIEVSARSCNLLDGGDTGEDGGHGSDGSDSWRGEAHGGDELSASGGMLGPGMGERRRVGGREAGRGGLMGISGQENAGRRLPRRCSAVLGT